MTATKAYDEVLAEFQNRREARAEYLAEKCADPAYVAELAEAFPAINLNREPAGYEVMVQLKLPKQKRGSIIMPGQTKTNDKFTTRVGKVIAIGPSAFRHRETLARWPFNPGCQIGDYIILPEHNGGDRRFERVPGSNEPVMVVMLADTQINAFCRDPLEDMQTINWNQEFNQ